MTQVLQVALVATIILAASGGAQGKDPSPTNASPCFSQRILSEPRCSTGPHFKEAWRRVGQVTINVLGFEQERRRLAENPEVDPARA